MYSLYLFFVSQNLHYATITEYRPLPLSSEADSNKKCALMPLYTASGVCTSRIHISIGKLRILLALP